MNNDNFFRKAIAESLDDNALTAYATVEVIDREGDIVRVDGISLDAPEGTSVKVFGTTHQYRSLPSGEPPIIGTVSKFTKTTRSIEGKNVPAATFSMEWAKGENGEITEYAAKFRGLYKSKTLDSFSIGFAPVEVKPLKGGRFDILKSNCFEISAAPLPMNKYATVIKSLKSALGDEFNGDELIETRLVEIAKSTDDLISLIGKLNDRLDSLESQIVGATVKARKSADRTVPVIPADLAKAIKDLGDRL